MTTATARTLPDGDGEMLPLPKHMGFGPGVELTLVRSGDVLTVRPTPTPQRSIGDMIDAMNALPGPGYVEERDVEEIPERLGL